MTLILLADRIELLYYIERSDIVVAINENKYFIDWFHFKSRNEFCMKLSEYFGMKVCYSTLKMKELLFSVVFEKINNFDFFLEKVFFQ